MYKYIVWSNDGSEGEFATPSKAARKAKSLITAERVKNATPGSEIWQMLTIMVEKVEVTKEEHEKVKAEEDWYL